MKMLSVIQHVELSAEEKLKRWKEVERPLEEEAPDVFNALAANIERNQR